MNAILDFKMLPGMEGTSSVPPAPEFVESAQVAPGQFVTESDGGDLPSFTLAKIIRGEGGEFTLEPAGDELGWVRLTADMAFAKSLKIHGLSYTTLRRLCYAGFIDYIQMAPNTMFVSVDGLMLHIERTKNSREDDGGFWTEEKLDAWRETYAI